MKDIDRDIARDGGAHRPDLDPFLGRENIPIHSLLLSVHALELEPFDNALRIREVRDFLFVRRNMMWAHIQDLVENAEWRLSLGEGGEYYLAATGEEEREVNFQLTRNHLPFGILQAFERELESIPEKDREEYVMPIPAEEFYLNKDESLRAVFSRPNFLDKRVRDEMWLLDPLHASNADSYTAAFTSEGERELFRVQMASEGVQIIERRVSPEYPEHMAIWSIRAEGFDLVIYDVESKQAVGRAEWLFFDEDWHILQSVIEPYARELQADLVPNLGLVLEWLRWNFSAADGVNDYTNF